MKAPDKIYLQVCGDCLGVDSCKACKFKDLEDNVTWCKDRIYKKDIEYIRKDALLELVKEKKKRLLKQESENDEPSDVVIGISAGLEMIIRILNSM